MIWYLEDEQIAESGVKWDYLVSLLNGQSFGFAGARASNAVGGYGVQVMNLTDANNGLHQDQLVYTGVPDGGMTLTLLGLGLVGLAATKRRFFI